MKKQVDVAIIGISGIFPGAGDIPTFWHNIENKTDAIRLVPENRLEANFFDALSNAVDRYYCRRGGFIDEFATFDPVKFGILPLAVEGTEPEQLLALELAHRALTDAAVFEKNLPLDKTGIIIGKGNYIGPGATRGAEIVRTGEQIAQILKLVLPSLKEADIDKVKKEFQVKKGRFGPDVAMGLVPNLVASLVANRLNLGGTAYTLDAACASSLIAIDHAVQELDMHRSDMVIAGGVHAGQNAPFWSIFTQLGALSRKEQIRPFDQQADGLLIGEGCGFVILKRLEDAVRDGHRIYAVIKGVGVSSDGAGASVMSPAVKGQSKAILQAWEKAQIDVSEIGYLEAHGTGTPLGDKTELETLAAIFGSGKGLPKAGIGSVKSMIGHAMPAAGIAGIIKTTLALYHGKLPPTLHCEQPLAAMQQTRFEPVSAAIDWDATGLPKRAGVNAFGFGGINAHVVLEGYNGGIKSAGKQFNGYGHTKKDPLLLLARESNEALMKALEEQDTTPGQGHYRIALFEPTPERIQKAIKIVKRDLPWRNRQDIWYSNDPFLLKGGKIAFLFPGLDALSGSEVDSVAAHFGLPATRYDNAASTELLQIALKAAERGHILDVALKQLGIQPDLNAGHSLGEWLAARSSGLATESSIAAMVQQLHPALFEIANTRFIAIGTGYDKLVPLLEKMNDIYLSIDNCPQQVILCGTPDAVDQLILVLKQKQVFHQVLPFQSGFHSPFLKDKLEPMLSAIGKMDFQKAGIPLWSATTLRTYPETLEAIRTLSVEHLVKPVRFRELTEKLYEEGVRVFIQVGSGGLTGFVDDTLKHKPYSAISANVPGRPGISQLQRVLAALFAEGKEIDFSFLELTAAKQPAKAITMKLQLGAPFVKDITSLKDLVKTSAPAGNSYTIPQNSSSPVIKTFMDNCEEIAEIQAEILSMFNTTNDTHRNTVRSKTITAAAKQIPQRLPLAKQLHVSLDNSPYLIDHSLMRQKPGWPVPEDMEPIIPMTMTLELFGEIAREHAPGEIVQKMMQVSILQWMSVAPPFKEMVKGIWKDQQTLLLTLEKYTSAEVLLANSYQQPAFSSLDTGASLGIHITPERIYQKRMFHGPAYQGIKAVTAIGEKGITGLIEGGAGKGSLLDNAGQLFGLWLQLTLDKENIAFPVRIQEVEFFSNMEDQEGTFECTCMLTSVNSEFAIGNFILKKNNRVWAIIRGWQNKRMEIDERLWEIFMEPLQHSLSEEIAPGVFFFNQAYTRAATWGFILKRYFNSEERKYHDTLPPLKRKEWIISRVAAKDAVRLQLQQSTGSSCYPIEFEIVSDKAGRPFIKGDLAAGIRISLAHKNTDAVAIARRGTAVGIDIEEIKDRSDGFQKLAFDPQELALIASHDQAAGSTRLWVAKEAYGKLLGTGLSGNPKGMVVEEINGDELRIKDTWIKTIQHKNYIIGWTK